jgi:hypothetical protein
MDVHASRVLVMSSPSRPAFSTASRPSIASGRWPEAASDLSASTSAATFSWSTSVFLPATASPAASTSMAFSPLGCSGAPILKTNDRC